MATYDPKIHDGFNRESVGVGLFVGCLLSFSNMYFGLQTGWVTMGSLQSALVGFGIVKLLRRFGLCRQQPFGVAENVIIQTTAVAAATMPLAGGFVSIIPALGMLDDPVHLTFLQLMFFTLGLAFFGVFFAAPIRGQVILREQLRFPSGTATAQMISSLHKQPLCPPPGYQDPSMGISVRKRTKTHVQEQDSSSNPSMRDADDDRQRLLPPDSHHSGLFAEELGPDAPEMSDESAHLQWKILGITFGVSAAYEFFGYFIPILKKMPVFGIGTAAAWGWVLAPSPSYLGQGMIMGMRAAASSMAGAIFGWAIIGPIARRQKWAPGPIDSQKTGAQGWLVWFALAIICAESLMSLVLVTFQVVRTYLQHKKAAQIMSTSSVVTTSFSSEDDETSPVESEPYQPIVQSHEKPAEPPLEYAPPHQRVTRKWWFFGLLVSSAACAIICVIIFDLRWFDPYLAVIVALLVSVLAVRALGQTDLNPVSGVGKLSQLVFAGIAPGSVLTNMIAGAISEAAAQQSGDMMQDFKTSYMFQASPLAQFKAQLIGSFFSVYFALAAWYLYTSSYEIPGPEFSVPSAKLWKDMAELINGGHLPSHLTPFCVVGGVIAAILPCIEMARPQWKPYMPSAVAFGIGMYLSPYWTIPRFLGSAAQIIWRRLYKKSHDKYMIVVASGLVLGEGIMAILVAVLHSENVALWSCAGCTADICPSTCLNGTTS
eukprot:m.192978 g.192978  ORF g.192978 m.192978 type:complete len:712 (+) comp25759_c0_seq4:54-2189(+)